MPKLELRAAIQGWYVWFLLKDKLDILLRKIGTSLNLKIELGSLHISPDLVHTSILILLAHKIKTNLDKPLEARLFIKCSVKNIT
jgi:hypothetical protein